MQIKLRQRSYVTLPRGIISPNLKGFLGFEQNNYSTLLKIFKYFGEYVVANNDFAYVDSVYNSML